MSLTYELGDRDSPTSRFLTACMTDLGGIEQQWTVMIDGLTLVDIGCPGSQEIGYTMEFLIGLDLAQEVPYVPRLRKHPADDVRRILLCAGYRLPSGDASVGGYENWRKQANPQPLDDARTEELLQYSWDLCCMNDTVHKTPHLTDDQQRDLVIAMRRIFRGSADDLVHQGWTPMKPLWSQYLVEGRDQLTALGTPVIIAPEFDNGFARADMIIGDTLIDVKTWESPPTTCEDWVRQILAYTLLDTPDIYGIRRVGIFLARHMHLITWNLTDIIDLTTEDALQRLRGQFRAAIQPAIDQAANRAQ